MKETKEDEVREILERLFNDARSGGFTEKGYLYKDLNEWMEDNQDVTKLRVMPSAYYICMNCYTDKTVEMQVKEYEPIIDMKTCNECGHQNVTHQVKI